MINLKKPKKFNPKQKSSLMVERQPIVGDFWTINVDGENWVVELDGLPTINTAQYYDDLGGVHVAHRYQPNNITVKLNRSLDNVEFIDSEFYRWVNLSQQQAMGVVNIRDSRRNVMLSKYNEQGNRIISYDLYNVFISGFEQNVNYDYDDRNFVSLTFELVLTFDYFQLTV